MKSVAIKDSFRNISRDLKSNTREKCTDITLSQFSAWFPIYFSVRQFISYEINRALHTSISLFKYLQLSFYWRYKWYKKQTKMVKILYNSDMLKAISQIRYTVIELIACIEMGH